MQLFRTSMVYLAFAWLAMVLAYSVMTMPQRHKHLIVPAWMRSDDVRNSEASNNAPGGAVERQNAIDASRIAR